MDVLCSPDLSEGKLPTLSHQLKSFTWNAGDDSEQSMSLLLMKQPHPAENPNTSSSQVTRSALSSCPSPAELAAWRGAELHDGAARLMPCTSTPHPNVRSPPNPKGRSFPQSRNVSDLSTAVMPFLSDNSSSWRMINVRAPGEAEEDVITDLK